MRIRNSGSQINDLANNQPFSAVSQDAPIIRAFTTGQALIGNIEDSVLDYIAPYAGQTYTGTIDDLGTFKTLDVPINSPHIKGNYRTDKHIGTKNNAPYDPMIAAATYATLAQRRLLQDIRKGYGQNPQILDRLVETEYEKQQISQQIRNIRGFQKALGNQFSTGIPDYLGEYALDAMEFTNKRVEDPTLKRFQAPMKALHQAYLKLPDNSPLKIKTNDPKTFYTTLSQVLTELAIGTLIGDKRIKEKEIKEQDWRNWIRSSAELLRFGVNTILKPIRNQILADINKQGDKRTIVSIRPKTLHKLIKERTRHLPKEQRARVLWFMSISGLAQVPEDDAQRVLSLDAIIDSLETAINLLEKEKKIKTTEGLARLVRDTFATVIGNAGHTPAYESAFRIYNAYYESRRRPELYGQKRATVTLQEIRNALQESKRDPSATRAISRNQGLLPFLSGQRNYIYITTNNGEQVSPLEYAEILKDLQKTKIVEEMTNLFEITEKIPITRTQRGIKIDNERWIDDIKKALYLEISRSLGASAAGVPVVQDRKAIEQAANQSTDRIINDLLRIKEFAKDGILTTVEYGQFRSILWNLEKIAKLMPKNSPVRQTIEQMSQAFERMEWLRDAANSVVPTSLQNTSIYTLYYGFSDEAISSVTGLFNPVSRTIGMANFFRSLASHRGGVYNQTIENALAQLDPNYGDVSLASRWMNPIGHQISAVGDFADVLTNLVTRPLQQAGLLAYKHVWGGMPASVDIYPWGALYDIEPYIAHWMEDAERMGLGRSAGAFIAMQILSMADPATIGITLGSTLLGPTGIGRAIGAGALGIARGLAPAGRAIVTPIRTLSTNFGRLRTRWHDTSVAQAINGKYAQISPRIQHAQRVANVAMIHGLQALRYGQGSALLIGDLADIVDAYYMGGGDPMTLITALVLNPEYVVSPRAGLARTSILIQPALDRISRYGAALSAAGPFLRPELQAHLSETKSLLESISVGPSSVFEKNSTILYYDRGDNTWKVGRVERYDQTTQKLSAYNTENKLVEGIDLSQVIRVIPRSIANNKATIQSGLAGATLGIIDTIRNKAQRNITVTKSALSEALGDLGKQAISVLEKTGIITHDTQTDALTLTRQGQNIAKALENPSESLMTYIGATIAKQIHPNDTKQQQKFIQKFTKGMSFVKPEYRSLYLMEAIVQTAHKAYGGARTVFAGILPLKGTALQYKNTTGYSPVISETKNARTDSPRLQIEGRYSDEKRTLPQDKKYITVENIALDIGENPDTISILEEILSLTLGTDVTLAGIKTDPKNKNIITGVAFELSDEKSPVEINRALNQINNDIQTTSQLEQEFGVHTPEELAMIYTIANVVNPLTELQQADFATERAFNALESYLEPQTGLPLLQVAQQESYKRFVGATPVTQRQVSELEKEIQKKVKTIRSLENKVAALELELEQYRTQREEFKRIVGGKRLEKEIRRTKNEIRNLQERVKNIREEYNNLTKQYEQYRRDVKLLYSSGGYSAAYLAEPNAIPTLHTAITAKVLADTSPDLTVSWGLDTLRLLKAHVEAFLASATNKEFYKNTYKQTYMNQLHKRMSKHLKQFSPEQIQQIIQESIDEWKTAPNIALSKIIRRITDGQYDEELLTNDTIFQSALASLNITLSGANNLEQLIGAYFSALSQDNLTLAAMYLTQLSIALNIANATVEEISRMANLSEDERLLMKEAALESVIVSAMSIESYLPSSPVSAATIDQQGRAVTYKEALEEIKQQAIEKYWQDIALAKIERLAKQTKTVLSEAELQSIKKLYTSHANDILRFYEIASTKDFEEAYARFVIESQLYKHMVGAFSQEMGPDKAKKFVREVMVAHHNMANANYATLYTDKQTLKRASKYLTDQPELIEALLLPLTQYAATQYTTQELNGILVPKPQVIMLGNAIWSTAAIAEETIHAMGDLIAAKVLQQYAQSAEPIAADRRFAQQIPFMKALTAYYSLDLGSLRRRTEIRKDETITPEELQALLDPNIAQERIIDVILTRKAMEDHANPFQALVAAGTWGGEKIRERIVQHAASALRYQLINPDKLAEYIDDSRLYLAAKADVLRHAATLTQAYEDAIAEKVDLEMNVAQPLFNWTDYFVMGLATLPRNEEERTRRRHEINSMRLSAAQDPEPVSTEAQHAKRTTITEIVLENLTVSQPNESVDGVALSVLATLSYLQRNAPDLLRDRTLDKNNLQTRGLVNQLVLLITSLKSGIEKEGKDVFEYLQEQQDNIKQMTSFTIGLSGQKTDKIVEFYLPIHNEYYKVEMIGGNGSIRINKVTRVDIEHLRTEHAKRLVMPNTTDDPIGKLVRYENKLFTVTGIAANGDLELDFIGISDDIEFERRGKTYLQINPTTFLTANITGTKAGSSIRKDGFAIETRQGKTYVLVDPFALLLSTGELPSIPTSPAEITRTLTVPEQASTLEKQPTVLYSVLELMRTIGWSVPALKQTENETITIAPTDEEVYTLADHGIIKQSKADTLRYLDTIIDSLTKQLSVEPNKRMLEVYSVSEQENLSSEEAKQKIRKLMINALNKISSLKDQISNLTIPDDQEIQFATTLDIIAQDTEKRLDVKYQELIAHLTQTELKDTALSTLFEKTERIREEKGSPTQQLNMYLGPQVSSTGTPKSYATNLTSFLTHVIRQALGIPVQPYEIRRYIEALGITDNAIPSNIQWYYTRPALRNQPEKLENIQREVDREIESTLIRAGLTRDQIEKIKTNLSESLSATIRSKQPVARTTPDTHLGIYGVSLLGDQAAQPTIEYLVLYAYGQPFAVGIQHASSPHRPRDRTLTSIYLLPNYDTVLQEARATAIAKAKLPTKVTVSRSRVETVPATLGKAGTFLHDIIDKDIARIPISPQTTTYKAYAAILHTAISKGVVFFPFGDSLSLQATGLLATYESKYLPDVARAAVLSLQKFIDTINSGIHIQSITNQINALQNQLSTITTQIAQMGTVSQERIDNLFLGLAGVINNLASQLRQTTYKDTLDNSIRNAIEEFYANLPVTPALQSQALSVEIENYNEAISAPNPEAVTDPTQASNLSDQGEPRRIQQTAIELAHQLQQKMAYIARDIVSSKIQTIEKVKEITLLEGVESTVRERFLPQIEQQIEQSRNEKVIADAINSITAALETIIIAISEQAADGSPLSVDPLGFQMLVQLRTEITAQFLTRLTFGNVTETEKDTIRDFIVGQIDNILQNAPEDSDQKQTIKSMKEHYEANYSADKIDVLGKLLQTWIIAELNLSQDNETRQQILNHLRFSGASQEGVPKSIASNLTLTTMFAQAVGIPYYFMGEQTLGQGMRVRKDPEPGYKIKEDQTKDYLYTQALGSGHSQNKVLAETNRGITIVPATKEPYLIGQGVLPNITTTTGLLSEHIHKLAIAPEAVIFDNEQLDATDTRRNEAFQKRIIYYETPDYILKGDIADIILFLYLGMPYQLTPMGKITNKATNRVKNVYFLQEDTSITAEEKARALENALTALHSIFSPPNNNPIHVPPGILGKLPSDPDLHPTAKQTKLGLFGNIIDYAIGLSKQTQRDDSRLWTLPQDANRTTEHAQIQEIARIIYLFERKTQQEQLEEDYRIIHGKEILETIKKYETHLNNTTNQQNIAQDRLKQDMHLLVKSLIAAAVYTVFSAAADNMHKYITAESWGADLERSLLRVLETIDPSMKPYTKAIKQIFEQYESHTPFARNGAYQVFGNINRIITRKHIQENKYETYDEEGNAQEQNIQTIPSYATIAEESLENIDDPLDPRIHSSPYYQTTREAVDPFDSSELPYLLDMDTTSLSQANDNHRKEATIRYLHRKGGYLIRETYKDQHVMKVMRGYPAPIVSSEMRLINAYTQVEQAIEFAEKIGQITLRKGDQNNIDAIKRTALAANGFFIRKPTNEQNEQEKTLKVINTQMRYMFSELFSIPPVITRNKNIDAIPIIETIENEGTVVRRRLTGSGIIQSELRSIKYTIADLSRLATHLSSILIKKKRQTPEEPNLFELFDDAYGVGVSYTYTPTSLGGRMGAFLYTAGAAITNFKLRGMSFLAQLSRLVISLDVGTFVPILASAGPAGMAALSAYLFAQKIDQYIRAKGARIYNPIALTSGFVRTAIRGLRYIGKTIAFSMFTDNMHAILLHKLRKELAQKYRIETRNRTTLDILRDLGTTKGRYFDLTYQETANAIFELLRNYGLDPANTIHLVAHAAAVARTFGYTSVLPTTLVTDPADPSDDITRFVNAIRPFAKQVIEDLEKSIQLYEKQAPLPFVWVKPRRPKQQQTQDDQIQLGEYQPNEQLLSAITKALSLLAEITYNTGNGKIQQVGNTFNLSHGIPSKLTANYGVATIYINLLFSYLQDNRLPMTNTNLTQDLITIARAILYDLKRTTHSDEQTEFWQALAEAAILRKHQPQQAQAGQQQQQQQQSQPQIDPQILNRAYEALHRVREVVDVVDVPKYDPNATISNNPTEWEGIQYLTKDRNSDDERILSAIPIAFVALKNKNRYKDLDYFRAFTRALALFEATLHNSPYSVNMVRGVMVQTLLLGTQSADLAHKIENAHIQRSYGMHTLMQIMSESSAMLAPTKPTPKATDIPYHTFYALTQIANSLQALNAMVAAVHGKLLPRGSPLGVLANVVNNYGAQLLALTAVGMLAYPQVVGSVAQYITSIPLIGPLTLGSMIFGIGLKAARQLLPPAGNLFLIARKAFSTNQLYPASEPLARSIIQGRQVLYRDIDALKQYTKRREDVNNLADQISNEDQNLIEHTLLIILRALNIYHINTIQNNHNALQEMLSTIRQTSAQQPRRTITIKLNKRFRNHEDIEKLDGATIADNIRNAIIEALKQYYNPLTSIPSATVGSTPGSNIINVTTTIQGRTYEIEIMNLDELQVSYNKENGTVTITLPTTSPAKLAQQLLAITLHQMGIIQLNPNAQNTALTTTFIPAINETDTTILDQAAQAIHNAVQAELNNIQGQTTTADIINQVRTHFLTVKNAIAELAAYTLSDGQSKAILTNTIVSEDVATDDTPIKKLKDGLASNLQNTRMFDLAVEMLLAITKPMAQEIERLFNTDTPVTSNYQQVGDIELQIENEHEFVARRLLEEIASAAGGNPEPLAEAIDQHYSRDAERYYDDSIKIVASRIKQLLKYLERSEQEIENMVGTIGGMGNRPYSSLIARIRSQIAAGNLTNDQLNEIVDFIVGLITARDQMTLQTAAIIDQLRMTNNALGQRMNNLTHEDANGIYIKRMIELLTLTDPEREAPSGYKFAEDGTLSQVSSERVAEDITIANNLARTIRSMTSLMIAGTTYAPTDPNAEVRFADVMIDIKNLMTTFTQMEVEARTQQRQMGFDQRTQSLTKHIASAMTQALGHLAEAMIARELMLRNRNTQTELSGEIALQHYANAMLLRAHLEQAAYEINKALLLTDSLAENDREIVLFLRTYNRLVQNESQIYPIINFIRQRILHRLAERIPNIRDLTQQEIDQFVPSFTTSTAADERIFRDAITEAQAIAQIRPAELIDYQNAAPTVALENEMNYRSTMTHIAHIMQEALTTSERLPNSFLSIYTMDLVRGYFDQTKTVMDDVKAIKAESPSVEFVKQVMKHKTDAIVDSLDKNTQEETKQTRRFIEELSDTISRISLLIILVGVQAAHRARTASQAFNNTLNLYSRAPQFMNILNSLAINIFNRKLFSKRKLIHMPKATLLLTAVFVLPTILGWFVAPAINLYRPNVAAGKYKIMLAPKRGDLVIEMPDYGTKYEMPIAGIPYSLSYDLSSYILQSITTPEGYSEETVQEIGGTAQDIATRILRGYFGGPTINTNILTRLANIAISKSTDSAVKTTPSFAYFGSYPYEYPIGTFFTDVMEQIISSPEGMVPRAIYRSYTTQDPRIENLLDLQRTDRLNTLEAVLKGASEGLGIQYRLQYFPYGSTNDPMLLELRPAFSNKIITIREPYTTQAANTINGAPYTPFTATNIGQFAIFQTDTRNVLTSRYNDLGWITRSDYRSNPVLKTYNLEMENYLKRKFRRFQPGRDLVREYTELLYLTRANLFGTRPDVSENPFLMQRLKIQLLEQAFNKPYDQISLEEETMFFAARSVALATASTQVQYYNTEDADAQTKAIRNALLLGHALQTASILYASPVEAEAITQAIQAELDTLLRNTEAYGNILTNPIYQRLLETAEAMGTKIQINLDVRRMNTEQINKQVQTELQKLLMTPREPHAAHEHGMIVFRDLKPTQTEGLNTMIRSEYQNDQFDVEIVPFRIRSERIIEQREARLGTEIQTKETARISRGVAIIIKHKNEETGQKEVVASYAYFENVLTKEKQPVSWALTPITIEKAEFLTGTNNNQAIRTLTNKLMENFVRDIFNKSLREYSVPQTVMWWMSQPRNKNSSDAYRLTKTLYAGLKPEEQIWAIVLETITKATERISTMNKVTNSKNNITRNVGITITTNNIQRQHTVKMIQEMINDAKNQNNFLDTNNRKRNEKYIRFLKKLLQDEKQIAMITNAANAAAQQVMKDLVEIFGVDNNGIRAQVLSTALYGTIVAHYAELNGYTSIIGGKEYERDVYPRSYTMLALHLIPKPPQNRELAQEIIKTVGRIEQSFTKLGGRIEPTEEQVNN